MEEIGISSPKEGKLDSTTLTIGSKVYNSTVIDCVIPDYSYTVYDYSTSASIQGDPHFVGLRGQHYDVNGGV